MAKLTPQAVRETFVACLWPGDGAAQDEMMRTAVIVHGITLNVGFHPERLAAQRETIDDLLDQLPAIFRDGMSFLRLCEDSDGALWTDSHLTCEELMLLGLAIGRVEYCLQHELWGVMPGGLPYFAVHVRKAAAP